MKNAIGPVLSIIDVPPGHDSGYGFVLYDDAGKPCASFVYADQETAENAADLCRDVLDGVRIDGLATQ